MMNIAWTSPRRLARMPSPAHTPPRLHDAPPLRTLGIEAEHYHDALRVDRGVTLDIASAIAPHVVTTWSLAELKSWIGVPDAGIDPATFPVDLAQVPDGAWNGRRVRGLRDLTPAERENVERAANLYVFGYSPWAESYREVVEICHAPFRAQVYPIRSLSVGPGARLVIAGEPAVLLVDDLVLEGGGQLALYTVCRAWIGRLAKIE